MVEILQLSTSVGEKPSWFGPDDIRNAFEVEAHKFVYCSTATCFPIVAQN